MMNDRWWIEHGRVGCDEAVGDGKSKRCLMLVELELDTCCDWHLCLSTGGCRYRYGLSLPHPCNTAPLSTRFMGIHSTIQESPATGWELGQAWNWPKWKWLLITIIWWWYQWTWEPRRGEEGRDHGNYSYYSSNCDEGMYLSCCPGLGVTTDLDSIASLSVICYHSLNNYHSPKVVQVLQGAQTQAMLHASWHCDSLEFYILYALFCNQIPWGYWCDDGWQGPQALEVWAWQWIVGYCQRSCLGTMGKLYLYFIELIPNISQSNSRMQPSSFHNALQGSLPSFPQWIGLPAISTQRQGKNSQLLSLKPWSFHARKWTATTPSPMALLHTALLWFYTLAWNSNIFATKIGKVNGLMWWRALFMTNY